MDKITNLPFVRTITKFTPTLVEPNVIEYYNIALNHCSKHKMYYYTFIYNICLFILFVFIVGGTLLWKFKGKRTPEEIEADNLKKKDYILSKIKIIDLEQKRIKQELITGLPHF